MRGDLSHEELLDLIAAGAEKSERSSRMPATTLGALRALGVFEAKLPSQLGGTGANLIGLFDTIEEIARVDGAAAWNASFMGTSAAWPAARLPDDGVAEVRDADGRWPLFAGTFVPSGQAQPADGGFRVDGWWGFASGVRHAGWVVAGCVRADTNAQVWCVLPVDAITVHDTWDAIGLRGTGSCDYTVDHVFVPAARTFDVLGRPRRGEHLHHLPILAFLTPDHTAITLGSARRALDLAALQAVGKQRLGSAAALANRGAYKRDLGRADTRLRSAYALVREVLHKLDDADEVAPELMLEARVAATSAAEIAIDIATFAYRSGGAHAALLSSPLGRAYRDTMTSSQHVYVIDDVYEQRADLMLSSPPAPPPVP